eukprot:CAMPEP_0115870466 /NCGR_PEP_ID=MMETSP0287-20121206/22341_1 /TAXON_ID=412157 /ORGANISM="Chrysochromulina rotalis, Strain UIO044" /LENGTH=105 /DNA_ID=CAMNT_0003325189 /DNA_START=204 /DNA_END=521 /DNA_ORIENTATION=+
MEHHTSTPSGDAEALSAFAEQRMGRREAWRALRRLGSVRTRRGGSARTRLDGVAAAVHRLDGTVDLLRRGLLEHAHNAGMARVASAVERGRAVVESLERVGAPMQ